MTQQVIWLFIMAMPIVCIAWTVTHEEVKSILKKKSLRAINNNLMAKQNLVTDKRRLYLKNRAQNTGKIFSHQELFYKLKLNFNFF